MFQIDWAQPVIWENEEQPIFPQSTGVRRGAVRRTSLLHWEEHCHECAIPTCYSSCSLYVPRADRRCSRFVYGIYPNDNFKGLFDFGADIRFRRWAKLETQLYGKSVSTRHHRILDWLNRLVMCGPRTSQSRPDGRMAVIRKSLSAKLRQRYFSRFAPTGEKVDYDEFVLECFSPENQAFRLTLEYFDGRLKARQSFNIRPGWNLYTVPTEVFKFVSNPPSGKLTLFPENDAEKRLVFTWLDLVQYREPSNHKKTLPAQTKLQVPAAKVKCVAWDLDDTLWKGILAEDSERSLVPRVEALDLVKRLDERGIIQTVVSKNNLADAWPVIERLGLQEYFLFPAINWQPKSSNLSEIAAKLNLNLDAFALIDDSPFERAEVQSALPQVRIYADDQISHLLSYSEFDIPVSETSKKRRASYQTEVNREKAREAADGNYETFLRSCEIKLRLFVPHDEAQIQRCLELIQRANQLNLSNTRYTAEEFRDLLSRPEVLCVAMDCSDRFGAYGIVGFASIDESGRRPILRDLVLSCRVARKRVEHAFIQWLARRESARASDALVAALVRTDRNAPILQVFDDLNFRAAGQDCGRSVVELPLDSNLDTERIITVEAEDELSALDFGRFADVPLRAHR
jgi:FkbH-like protein